MPLQGEHGETQPVAVALRQLSLAVGLQQQGQVCKLRHGVGPSEGFVEQHMERSTRQPLLAADDVGNLHQVVVDDVGQVVGGQLVGTLEQHLVVDDVGLHAHLATDQVIDQHLVAGLHLEAHHILPTVGYQLVDLLFRQRQRVAHLAAGMRVVLEVLYLAALLLQLLRRVEGYVGLAGIEQLLHIFLIDVAALTLAVGPFVAAERYTLVELDAQPLERLDDVLLGTGYKPRAVGVLNTENEVAAMLAGKQIIIQGSAHTTDM